MGIVQRQAVKFVLAVVHRPRLTLLLSALALVASVMLAVGFLKISTDQNKLFSAKVPFFRDYLDFIEQFPENEAIYVVIESAAHDKAPALNRWTSIADSIDARLRTMSNHVVSVSSRVKPSEMGPYGLMFAPHESLPGIVREYREFVPLLKRLGEKPGFDAAFIGEAPLERLIGSLQGSAALAPADFKRSPPLVTMVAQSVTGALRQPDSPIADHAPDFSRLSAETPDQLGYMYLPDESDPKRERRILLVSVFPVRKTDSLTAISETVDAIRAAVAEEARAFPEFKVGLTGRPALEADEMRTSDTDTRRAEMLAITAVFIGLVVMLRSFWLALVAEISLGVGIGWTFGWAALSVGQLNLLSLVFVIALVGIGMDYLIQVLTRYRQESARYVRPKAIWARVFRYVSPPISTACVGAAGAFLVSALTDFQGAAELGIIAGGGLLLCLLAGYTVLPAILVLWPSHAKPLPAAKRYTGKSHKGGAWRLAAPAIWFALILAGIPLARRVSFDPNLLNLQAQHLESVQLVHRLQTWSAVVLSKDKELLRDVRDALRDAPTVAKTESILDADDNAAWLKAHEKDIPAVAWTTPRVLDDVIVKRVANRATLLADAYRKINEPEPADALKEMAAVLNAPRTPEEQARLVARINAWQSGFIATMRELSTQFAPPPLDTAALPPTVRNHFVGHDGRYALYILPKEDLWERAALERFLNDIEPRVAKVNGAPAVTGIASNIFHSTTSIKRSFILATFYALGLVVLLVYLDLRNVGQTLLAISVLGLGLPMLMVVMGLAGVSWNFANFFGLPILIGAGHEYGVFMVHRYREVLHDPRRVWHRWDVSDHALLLCAFVTSSSFAFFWAVGHHEGLRSLGWVMAVGTLCIYTATVLVVRVMLIWHLQRIRARSGA